MVSIAVYTTYIPNSINTDGLCIVFRLMTIYISIAPILTIRRSSDAPYTPLTKACGLSAICLFTSAYTANDRAAIVKLAICSAAMWYCGAYTFSTLNDTSSTSSVTMMVIVYCRFINVVCLNFLLAARAKKSMKLRGIKLRTKVHPNW